MEKLYAICLFLLPILVEGQTWETISESAISRTGTRQIIPNDYLLAKINDEELKNALFKAPLESSDNRSSKALIDVMLADGSIDQFRIVEYIMMEEGLAKKFPDFKTFHGRSISAPERSIRIDYTTAGFRAVISDENGKSYIDPFQTGDTEHRIIYRKSDISSSSDWSCGTESKVDEAIPHFGTRAGDCMLRTYRLACAATGEYTAFHGGTVATGQAAIVTSVNRVNEIYEQDLSTRFILIANNDQLVFTNGNTDPFTNDDGFVMLGQNQNTIDNVIGTANYDIGHVYSTGGGGVANLESLCTEGSKARGVTGLQSPINDPFWIDYVCHEIGHQFGGNHTQNNNCNRNNSTAMETGSGSTIMGYAGICAPDVQQNSDAYFHAISIQEMTAHITGAGNCGVNTDFGNMPPVLQGVSDHTVPASTFLALEASATDADGDLIRYCWEQLDNQVATMPPLSTNTGGPAFRSLSPTTNPIRYLPSIDDIISNSTDQWEVLPSVSRTMNFRVTVRDQIEALGCTDEDDMVISVDGNSGPFLVTNNSIPAAVLEGDIVNLQWDVAGTDQAPVNATNVDIFLSVDGGLTYPTVVLLNTPNDGSENISIPVGTTTTARIMVKGSGNIFFDINDSDFEIQLGSPTFSLSADPNQASECNNEDFSFDVITTSIQGFSDGITLSANGIPNGSSISFSPNPVTPGSTATATLSNLAGISGTFNISIDGSAGVEMKSTSIELNLVDDPVVPSLTAPANGASNVVFPVTFDWNDLPAADSYNLQVSTSPNAGNIISDITVNVATETLDIFDPNTTYYWRVRSANLCGNSSFSPEFSFTTANLVEVCETFMSTDVPLDVPDLNEVYSSLLIENLVGTITDIDVVDVSISHNRIQDIDLALIAPTSIGSTRIDLIADVCENDDNLFLTFDDEGASTIPCPPTDGGSYQSIEPLSAVDGEDPNGNWQLAVFDDRNSRRGELISWGLRVCYDTPVACNLNVTSTAPTGDDSLMEAINCASPGDIVLINLPPSSVIDMALLSIAIDKDLTITSMEPVFIDYSGSNEALKVSAGFKLTMNNITLRQNP